MVLAPNEISEPEISFDAFPEFCERVSALQSLVQMLFDGAIQPQISVVDVDEPAISGASVELIGIYPGNRNSINMAYKYIDTTAQGLGFSINKTIIIQCVKGQHTYIEV